MDEPLPPVLQALWGIERGARRGPRPQLTVTGVARAGIELADAEGLAAVSMARVAKQLGVTPMALYRYVASKDELVLAMVDEAYGPCPVPAEPADDWRAALAAWCRAMRRGLLRHPWVLQIPVTEPPLTPYALGWMEAGLAALARTPLTQQQRLDTILLGDVYTRGQTLLGLQVQSADSPEAALRYVLHLRALVSPESHPHVWAAQASGALEDEPQEVDFAEASYEFGLGRILDGVAELIGATGAD
ncbi:TetR family transcriptional regulator [Motilibacter rhizosphaerae]|uniref:TetR family transcriptional regulator n=1 Tax=Motilibacter rhizosphaerae TaxID=598652 RepID=A0A4Q7NAX4_9ACTN|nr:TetR/AcrR family transcriptional regulator [Motilibacter rhizosphaerae]RZS80101.1 TetR family transcriptional regulator [Motilibacter rhizosphaerae]